ncbi:UNVERIFIED_ORG: glycosyl hydrolase family 2 [Chitinophaga ginsengisegetis]
MKLITTSLLCIISNIIFAQGNERQKKPIDYEKYHSKPTPLVTRWAKDVTPGNTLKDYPRPQMVRKDWKNLNGLWEYAITDSNVISPFFFDGSILVPYPLESALSGVQKSLSPEKRLWYRTNISNPSLNNTERILLHFGAIDWQMVLFINNVMVGQHTGGYNSFYFDITNYLKSGDNELLIKVYDPSDKGLNPHGKQVLNPGNIYYTPSSGIWQTVWLEKVPESYIDDFKLSCNIDNNSISVNIKTTTKEKNLAIEAVVKTQGKVIATKKVPLPGETADINIDIPNSHLWSPDDPFLYDLSFKLLKNKETIDSVDSYFGMRKIDIQKDTKGFDRIFLNNKYTYNLGILDQGFWPEGLYTAPTDEALEFDIKAVKAMGFNTIRKHIKIEPDRWYYHADKIGVLVWQDFVNPPHSLPDGSKPIFEGETSTTINQLFNHPCIISWVVFNERWGAYDQKRITEFVKKIDTTRIVNGHSGELLFVDNQLREPSLTPWESSDVTDVHSYPEPRTPPGLPGKAKVLGEFGGVGVSVFGHEWDDIQGWGYIQVKPIELKSRYENMTKMLKDLEANGLSASIYTQPYDVEGEENGLLTYDREIIKIPIDELRSINKIIINQLSTDTGFIIANNIDIKDNDDKFGELLNKYEKGDRDSIFLRRLTLMAIRKKDQKTATKVGNDYLGQMSYPFSKENLTFMFKTIRTSKDVGFKIFQNHVEKVNSRIGEKMAELKIKEIINNEEIEPFLVNDKKTPNWDSIQHSIINKYGSLGEELILGKRMIYYYTVTQDWKNFGKYYMLYFQKALKHPEYLINNITWPIFEHVNDVKILEFAAEVMRYDLETWDSHNAEAYDTYANLLHKLNNSKKAIEWEEKALKMKKGAFNEKIFVETLQKMKAGLPTWPQNN